ncbi:MAG: heat-inducible transcriptional repressor HrcA [Thermodesulfovibrionales bacterium]|nr:heat-inducible transcriptional repressor HrcA [Thermodesulfovibrionales bacterium]
MLDERSKQILYAIIESYIDKPEPVGSRFVTKKYPFGFSSATIRNIMADLEEFGFLSQPHTSAGRIPTDKGYRFYVDSISGTDINKGFVRERMDKASYLHYDDSLGDMVCQFTKKLGRIKNDMNAMFSEVINTLSSMSNYVSVALPPKTEKTTFNRIDLIRYKDNKAVAILLTNEGVIKNKVLKIDASLAQEDINSIADYLNSEYAGHTLDEIRGSLVKRMKQEKLLWDEVIAKAIKICEQALLFTSEDIFVSGLYDVINLPDFSNILRIKQIAKAIKDKHLILRLLDEFSDAEGVQVLIGSEHHYEELNGLSVVASPYKEGDRPMGVIALIGPTRMNYPKAIYMVDRIAKCISKTLSD